MQRFSYTRADTIPEAIALLNETGMVTRPIAGGTDLLLQSRHEKVCDRVVDISQIRELHGIHRDGGWVSIGAAATFTEIIESQTIYETAPVLVQACSQIGATQIRNMGTIGGNAANAAACADSLPALVCLDAVACIHTLQGEYEQPVGEFVLSPNRTTLPAGALIVAFRYRVPAPGTGSAFLKLGRRNAMAISRLTVAAMGRLDDVGRITEARLAPGSAAPRIVRFPAVEAVLNGRPPGAETYDLAGQTAVEEMTCLTGKRWSSEFKEPALKAMVARAFKQVFNPLCEAKGMPE